MGKAIKQKGILLSQLLMLVMLVFVGVMCFTGIPSVSADEGDSEDDPIYVYTEDGFNDALDRLSSQDSVYIKIAEELELFHTYNIEAGKTVSIEMDGKSIQVENEFTVIVSGSLTIKDSSDQENNFIDSYWLRDGVFNLAGGSLNLQNIRVRDNFFSGPNIGIITCTGNDSELNVVNSEICGRENAITSFDANLCCNITGRYTSIEDNIIMDNGELNISDEPRIKGELIISEEVSVNILDGYFYDSPDTMIDFVDSVYCEVEDYDGDYLNSHVKMKQHPGTQPKCFGEEADPYEIETEEELIYFLSDVQEEAQYAVLTDSIEVKHSIDVCGNRKYLDMRGNNITYVGKGDFLKLKYYATPEECPYFLGGYSEEDFPFAAELEFGNTNTSTSDDKSQIFMEPSYDTMDEKRSPFINDKYSSYITFDDNTSIKVDNCDLRIEPQKQSELDIDTISVGSNATMTLSKSDVYAIDTDYACSSIIGTSGNLNISETKMSGTRGDSTVCISQKAGNCNITDSNIVGTINSLGDSATIDIDKTNVLSFGTINNARGLTLGEGHYGNSPSSLAGYSIDTTTYEVLEENKDIDGYTYRSQIVPISDLTEPAFKGHSMVLTDKIGVEFYIVTPADFDPEFSHMDFSGAGIPSRIDTGAPEAILDDGRKRYKFTTYVNVIEMAEKITPTFYYRDEDDDETSVVGDAYSAEDYLRTLIAEDYAEKDLAIDLIDYGAYTQQYMIEKGRWSKGDYAEITPYYTFNEDYYNLARDVISEAERTDGVSRSISISGDSDGYVVSPYYSVKCGSDLGIKLYFKTSDGTMPTVTIDGEEAVVDERDDGYYTVMVPAGYANVLSQQKEVVINDSVTINVCGISYAKDILNNDKSDEASLNLACALTFYASSAEYFGQ